MSHVVHWELTDGRKGAPEKARRGGHDNQTEQEETQAHITAARFSTAKGKFTLLTQLPQPMLLCVYL